MPFAKDCKLTAIVFCFIVVTVVKAGPTIENIHTNSTILSILSNPAKYTLDNLYSLYGEYKTCQIASISIEILAPPAELRVSDASLSAEVNSLPPVPKAFFMALAGFLCVTLFRDRKTWLTISAGLIWLIFIALPHPIIYWNNKKVEAIQTDKGSLCLCSFVSLCLCASVPLIVSFDPYICKPINRLVGQVRQTITFLSTFVFASIPRGPPELALRC